MEIKLVVIDIDGTLLDSEGSLAEENQLAIQAVEEKGVQVVLCTGRPIRSAQYLLAELDLLEADDLIITSNGGLIQQAKTGEIIQKVTFTREESFDIYQLGKEYGMPVTFIDLDYVYEPEYPKGRPSIYTGGEAAENQLEFLSLDMESLPEPFAINQIIMSRPAAELDAVVPKIPPYYYEKYNIFRSLPFILEFVPKQADKGNALDYVGELIGVQNEEIMGIGDQENDRSLVKNAGLGIAMANAIDEVKEAADYITKSNDDLGVAYALHKFILNNDEE